MRILSITGNRADYDLLSYLYRYLNEDSETELGLVVTGGHLVSGGFSAAAEIRKDGNRVIAEIEDILNSDNRSSRAKSTGILLQSLADVTRSFSPDLILAPGDREDVIAAGITAAYMRIPMAHFFGGDYEASGHVDNLIRHATSKLATAHFVSSEEHKRRLMAMGEDAGRIFVIGSVALDKFREEPYLSRAEVFSRMGAPAFDRYALLIYHPPAEITGENQEIACVLQTLKEKGIPTFVSSPNTDYNHSAILEQYRRWEGDPNFFFYRNLDRNTFINLYRNADFQIGNSSSGVCEAASIPLPVINVGSRQKRRGNTENVLIVEDCRTELSGAIDKALSPEYREAIRNVKNILGDGRSSRRAFDLIKTVDFRRMLLKTSDPLEEAGQ